MNLKKHMLLVVGCGLAVVLLGVALYFLFRFEGSYQGVRQQLDQSRHRLQALQRQDPFPSSENVKLARLNEETLSSFFHSLMADLLSPGGLAPEKMEPAEFKQRLDQTIKKLRAEARGSIILPPRFAFGFEVYDRGLLPKKEEIPRLVTQLKTIQALTEILYASKISELTLVERDAFDQVVEKKEDLGSARFRRRPTRPLPTVAKKKAAVVTGSEGKLYAREPVMLQFVAREGAMWAVLNALARADLFTLVTEVELTNEAAVSASASPATRRDGGPLRPRARPQVPDSPFAAAMGIDGRPGPGEDEPEEIPTQDERIVAGNERVVVKLQVDVYRFIDPDASDAEAEAKP